LTIAVGVAPFWSKADADVSDLVAFGTGLFTDCSQDPASRWIVSDKAEAPDGNIRRQHTAFDGNPTLMTRVRFPTERECMSIGGQSMNRIEVDVYSDFVCPWCFIGSRRLRHALTSFGDQELVIRHHPYVLFPNASVDGVDLTALLAQRYRQSPEAMLAAVEAAGREAGLPLAFSRVTRV
jgi:hypothetical protein